ncbi:hypothetical protein K432DRAFT_378093 [Lepidopterella palustris CBS 459.81]|uniref:Uncharacterized protein n=1 Tax=Lepidopterella palustris CBS 459.81 TaxID=1314670 RepID=A0A8E2EK39_9PEZI|nr:hypothetical protein K432DRAFT_378093 [Lepidopterella palustris CBS 459.81]
MSNPRTPDHRHSASNRGTAALVMTPFASSQLLRSLQTRQNAFEGLYGRTTSESESRFARLEARINDLEASENRLERLEARIRDLQVQVADLLSSYKDA